MHSASHWHPYSRVYSIRCNPLLGALGFAPQLSGRVTGMQPLSSSACLGVDDDDHVTARTIL